MYAWGGGYEMKANPGILKDSSGSISSVYI